MSNILFIKTSSLGDVIHHMPAGAEARRWGRPGHFASGVETALACLARLPPGGGGGYGSRLHATARGRKEWRQASWMVLGQAWEARGGSLMVPWGTPAERLRSERIAAAIAGAIVPDRQPLDVLARLIARASFV